MTPNVKLEETKNRRRLHIGSCFVDLNESEYRELVRIFSIQYKSPSESDAVEQEEMWEELQLELNELGGLLSIDRRDKAMEKEQAIKSKYTITKK